MQKFIRSNLLHNYCYLIFSYNLIKSKKYSPMKSTCNFEKFTINENLQSEDIQNALKDHKFIEIEEIEDFINKFK